MKNLKKTVVAITVLGGVMLALPSNVAAGNSSWCKPKNNHQPKWTKTVNNDNDTVVVKVDNQATVVSETTAIAKTGGNSQSHNDDGNHLMTGDAKAKAVSTNVVNTTTIVIGQN